MAGPRRLLLVEDDAAIRVSLEDVLRGEGYKPFDVERLLAEIEKLCAGPVRQSRDAARSWMTPENSVRGRVASCVGRPTASVPRAK